MNISIEYCVVWNYEPRALSLGDELTYQFGYNIVVLKAGDRGAFEVFVNNQLIFSKLQLDRFPNEGEIKNLINTYIKNGEIKWKN